MTSLGSMGRFRLKPSALFYFDQLSFGWALKSAWKGEHEGGKKRTRAGSRRRLRRSRRRGPHLRINRPPKGVH